VGSHGVKSKNKRWGNLEGKSRQTEKVYGQGKGIGYYEGGKKKAVQRT